MSAMKEQLLSVVEAIDAVMGDGYAKKNPELVGRMVQAEQLGFGVYQITEALHVLAGDSKQFTL